MFQTRRINNAVVTPLQLNNQHTPDQIYGYEFCTQPYATWLLCGKSRQGKGTAMYQILKHTIDPLMGTQVIIFSSTVHRDPLWEKTLELLEKKKCTVTCHAHFLLGKRGRENILTELIAAMDEPEEPEKKDAEPPSGIVRPHPGHKKKVKKPTKVSSKWLIIFDDLPAQDMRNEALSFVMRNRHYKIKVIMSVQYLNMLMPGVRKQITNAVLFRSFSEEKLHSIYADLDIEIDFDKFCDLYRFATAEPYQFLQYDVHGNRWLKNFNEEISVQDVR